MAKLDISILLVEDDMVIRSIYHKVLSDHVETVIDAVDGQDGYNNYSEHNPDLILTDIRMPIMNGLDMIKKIRKIDKTQRIIIMSAYGESRFFLKAIESGVKGFLVKPFDTEYLLNIIEEQANDILLEKRLKQEAEKRLAAENERDKAESILKALSQATAAFLRYGVNNSTVNDVLKLVGKETGVSRTYIFNIHKNETEDVASQIYEWTAEGINEEINNEKLTNVPLTDPVFELWFKNMSNHKNVIGVVKDFDEITKSILNEQNILSILAIPIYVKDVWWGFIGFDDCLNERIWTQSEINALEMLATNLGGAIYRRDVENNMANLNASLEEHVLERTEDLEKEIVERINVENLLRESEEKYRLIYENANDGIILLINSIITLVNPKMSEIINVLPKKLIGNKFTELLKEEYRKDVHLFFNKQKMGSEKFSGYYQVQLLDGRWLELKSTCITWDNNSANLVFVSDINKRKIAEQDLHELNRDLELRIKEEIERANEQQQLLVQKSKLESIGELTAGLAHEINQPLGGLSMGLDNIIYHVVDNKLDIKYLMTKINLLFKDIERIRKIIEHVRVFSRDQDNLVFNDVSINDVINNALSLVSKQIINNDIKLEVNLPEKKLITLGNEFRLEQVILNLLSNSKQAINEKARLNPKNSLEKTIIIEVTDNESDIIITVTDNGVGIKKNILSKIFNPFFTTKSEEKGTGLGLSISYGIISEMNGKIEAKSKVNKFTTVIITLPKK